MTSEQRQQRDELAALVEGTGRRLRIVEDVEGWPIVPGSRGQVEVIAYPGGARALAVYTRSRFAYRELLEVPGCRRLQVGDGDGFEARVLAPWTAEALGQMRTVLKADVVDSQAIPWAEWLRPAGFANHSAGGELRWGFPASARQLGFAW